MTEKNRKKSIEGFPNGNFSVIQTSDLMILEKNKLFSAVLESFFDGILITDGRGIILYINRAYERISGLTKKEVLGKNVEELVSERMVADSVVRKVLKSQRTESIIHHYETGRKALASSIPIFDEAGKIVRVVCSVRDISELMQLRKDLEETREITARAHQILLQDDGDVIIRSESMIKILEFALRAARFDSNILLTGESGAGKEEVAKLIYKSSSRSKMPFIKINCSAIPATLIESELFGYKKGSFTGAKTDGKPGYFELSNGGTLLLDEIGEIPIEIQPKILRAIQEGEILSIGDSAPQKVDVRIIAITNKDLYEKVLKGEFRQDLFFRLNVVPIKIPPLRERREEIAPLIYKFLNALNNKYGVKKSIDNSAISQLLEYRWPGNVRELKNLVEYLFIASNDSDITLEHLPGYIFEDTRIYHVSGEGSLNSMLASVERGIIAAALKKNNSLRKAAASLKVSPATLCRKIKKNEMNVS